jgi:hypothetical protein
MACTVQYRNRINIFESYAEIEIYKKDIFKAKVLIDIEDVEKVKHYVWVFRKEFNYVVSSGVDYIWLHNLLMNNLDRSKGIVDHINRNTLDNRKINLRITTRGVNRVNADLGKNNTSGCTGVYYGKREKGYFVMIGNKKGKMKYVGFHKDKIEAIKIRQDAIQKEYGITI